MTLIRTPRLPPTYARFIVPLRMNKLDIRDYLYHAYGVTVLSVRSFVQQQKVRHDKPDAERPRPRRWFRPRAIKRMTVEMERPFVWPEEPEDFEASVLFLAYSTWLWVSKELGWRVGSSEGAFSLWVPWGYGGFHGSVTAVTAGTCAWTLICQYDS